MAQATQAPPRPTSAAVVPSVVTLAFWRLRQSWRLLLLTGAGFLAAVIMVCSVPLFSQMALTAGLRNLLAASADDSQIAFTAGPYLLSSQGIAIDKQQTVAFLHQRMGTYLAKETFFHLTTSSSIVAPPLGAGSALQMTGADFPQAAPHIHLLQGHLPSSSSDQMEILITDATAFTLSLHIGDTISSTWTSLVVNGSNQSFSVTIPLRVAGIISPTGDDDFWHGQTFQPDRYGYKAIMSNDAFLKAMDAIAREHGGTAIASRSRFSTPAYILWYFPLQASVIAITNLDDLIARLNTTQIDTAQPSMLPLLNTQVNGPMFEGNGVPSSLERLQNRGVVLEIPAFILAAQVLALILFFVSIMANLLIERQAQVIALLRSRGASRRQIFGSFVVQSVALGLVALVAGPLLALLVILLIGRLTLAASDQNALNVITDAPLQAAFGVAWAAVPVVVVVVLGLLLSIWSAARRDVLTMRREAARATSHPLWQRLRPDVVAAVVAVALYGASVYISQARALDTNTYQVIALPLSLVGPMFLLIAGLLLVLRLFQYALRLLAWRAARRPSAPPMLALAQMSRAPQASLRAILLLALAAVFAVFSLVFDASEQQQIRNVAAQQVGADFSGDLPTYPTTTPTIAQWEQSYGQVAGVTAASAGYLTLTSPISVSGAIPLMVEAVDSHNFAQAAAWSNLDADQPLANLLAQINQPQATQGQMTVPAIVDAVAWNALHLAPGARFNIAVQGIPQGVPIIAVAEVQHIPGVNDSLATSGADTYVTPGGIIVDYQRFASLTQQLLNDPTAVAANHLWLRTSDAPAALAKVRQALTEGTLHLLTLSDRRALIDLMQRDPLYVAMHGILLLGTITALLVALVGALVTSWLNARSRLTNFALLRALGSAPRQIASVFVWEQGIIYAVAGVLGLVFGGLLALTSVPGLVFANPIAPGNTISDAEFYVIQRVLPTQVIWPATLGLAVLVFCVICGLALALMMRVVSQPSISQTLRLNED
jgi:ABC-type antimicrobial peptide transport system permease subunit